MSREYRNTSLNIGGLVPFTSIDFPGKMSAVVFCQGCLWQCSYCHNKHLRSCEENKEYRWDNILRFLYSRKNWLDAVVFSGGEPTLQEDLYLAIQQVKEMGLQVAIHTTGFHYTNFEKCLPLIDWVGFDLKAYPDQRYDLITGVKNSYKNILKSLHLLINSTINYELRITSNAELAETQDIDSLTQCLHSLQDKPLKIQKIRAVTREDGTLAS